MIDGMTLFEIVVGVAFLVICGVAILNSLFELLGWICTRLQRRKR